METTEGESPVLNGRTGDLASPYAGRYFGRRQSGTFLVGCGNPACGLAYELWFDPGDGGVSECSYCGRWTETDDGDD